MLVEPGHVPAAEGSSGPLVAGSDASGDYQCVECGYGVTVRQVLPTCPMCGSQTWERTVSRRFVLG